MFRRAWLKLLAAPLAATVASDFLMDRLNRFAAAYNAFASAYQQGTFDLRGAKLLSKLWRDIEQSGNWPERKN